MKASIAPLPLSPPRDDCLSIEVTTRCNGQCRHCFAHAGRTEYASLSPAVVKRIIAEGYKSSYRRLHITGGEPLLWDGLYEALDFAFDLGYQQITMNTNGRLLTGKIAGRLAAYADLSISMSLEGPQALHERIRGHGTYRLAIRGIDEALNAGIDLVIFSVAGKSLLEVLPRFVYGVYKRFPGIQHLTLIQLIVATHNGFDLENELLEPQDFIELVQTVCILNLCGLDTRIKNSPLARLVCRQIDIPWVLPTYPLYRNGSLIVRADGNILLSHSSNYSLGKYVPGMIQRVLSSREYRRAVAPDQSKCPACQYRGLCRQNGMYRPSEANMDLHPDIPYCKRVLDLKPGKDYASTLKEEDIVGSGTIYFQPEHLT